MQKRFIWRVGMLFVLAAVAAMIPLAGTAQKFTSAARHFSSSNRAELESFDDFLDAHPNIALDLARNPSLVKNEEFRLNHPSFDEFLKNHAAVESEIGAHPGAFVIREHRFSQVGEHISRYELDTFDHLLAIHPQVASELRANPGLVNDAKFLARHADLREFFEDHPHLRENLTDHPLVFLEPDTWSGAHDHEQPVVYHPGK